MKKLFALTVAGFASLIFAPSASLAGDGLQQAPAPAPAKDPWVRGMIGPAPRKLFSIPDKKKKKRRK